MRTSENDVRTRWRNGGELFCFQSRYGRITPMAKTLQEDPSCQLFNILRKYLLTNQKVDEYLKDDVPHLSTLRQVRTMVLVENGF